jgi:hypothetical protein
LQTGKLSKFANRQISQQKLSIDFKTPWHLLYKIPAEARAESPSEAEKKTINSIWWCLLDKIRTHFEKNPDDEF